MSLSILNVGEGDTRLTFDRDKPDEIARTRRIITDMLKLGYAILVRIGETAAGKPKYRRAVGFDAKSDEYLVMDVPAPLATGLDDGVPLRESVTTRRRGRPHRIKADGTKAVAVARSAGGMSDRADSIEVQNMEHFDSHAQMRNMLRTLSSHGDQWAGLPMALEGTELVIEPRYPLAHIYRQTAEPDPDDGKFTIRNQFYSHHRRQEVVVFSEGGKIDWGVAGGPHHLKLDLETMGASVAWGIEQEAKALQLLAEMLPHHAFKKYLLTGMFLETSERSGVTYIFRRLRPTIAASGATGDMRILAVLCQHPIAYYAGSWAGAMCPSDDVIAHLTLMRGDEPLYWRRSNQHAAYRREAGL